MNTLCLTRLLLTGCGLLALPNAQPALAQGTQADYERAAGLREQRRNKVFRTRVEPHWFDDNRQFWYRLQLAGDRREFVRVNAASGQRQPAFDHERLATSLSGALSREVDDDHLPFEWLEFDGESFLFKLGDQGWRCSLEDYSLTKADVEEPTRPETPRRRRRGGGGPSRRESPDERWSAVIRDHNVVIKNLEDGDEFALSTDGSEEDSYGARVYWSPDATKLVAIKTRAGEDHQVQLIESSPDDQVQPKLRSFLYRKPGDRMPVPKPRLFDLDHRREIVVSDDLFPNPWSVSDVRWEPDSSRFLFLYNQRGHQLLRVVAVDAGTGKATSIIEETSATFLDYAHKEYTHHVKDTGEIIWMSERDGWNHLYLYDGRSGEVKHQITRGEWVDTGVDRVDDATRQIWFRAGGIHPGQDPYFIHHARVNFDGTGLLLLTQGDGTHAIDYSPDRTCYIDRWSRVDFPTVTELRRSDDGSMVAVLERGDDAALRETGWRPPEAFVAKGRDGQTDIHGVIYRPMQLEPGRSYPVIEAIYAGPQGSFVPKSFRSHYRHQELAELGFVVVQIDGMGTSHRSKKFHDVCWKNLKDAGFPDRIAWMKAAAQERPYMDLERVGVFGGSAGGQSALGGLLFHPEFYKAGAADCGCHDNRMDKIWWNELWMGWPVGPEYADNSNVTHAGKLEGKLLLTVGELDRNVDPASTLQVVDALIKAGKDFDFVLVPGAGHGVGGSPYLKRRRADFFVRHLLGVEPRSR